MFCSSSSSILFFWLLLLSFWFVFVTYFLWRHARGLTQLRLGRELGRYMLSIIGGGRPDRRPRPAGGRIITRIRARW
jgi:hypothetical protein